MIKLESIARTMTQECKKKLTKWQSCEKKFQITVKNLMFIARQIVTFYPVEKLEGQSIKY